MHARTPAAKPVTTIRSRGEMLTDTFQRFAANGFAQVAVSGSLDGLSEMTVAIVGSTSPSEAAKRIAARLAFELADAGFTIVSIADPGIDTTAIEAAIAAGGPVIAITRENATGEDCVLPRRVRDCGGGVLRVAEATHKRGGHNGVLSIIADAVVVIEAGPHCPALDVAMIAKENRVPIMAFPGDIDRLSAAGSNALIRDGAQLVASNADVLSVLGTITTRAHRAHVSLRKGA